MAVSDLNPPLTDRRSRASAGPRLFERAPVLAELEAIFSQTLQVPSRCIAIEGSWGSGRTALVNAACESAGRSDCLVLRAKGGDVEKQVPFSVLGRFVESAAAIAVGTPVAQQADALSDLLASGTAGRLDPSEVSPLFHALVIALRGIRPVLLAVDDADLADRETLAVLQYVVRRLDNQQIWLLVAARPLHPGEGLRPVDGLLNESETRQFILEPLHEESIAMMLAGFFDEEPDPQFVEACLWATGGIPLFLKTLLPCLARAKVRPVAAMAGQVERIPAPKLTQLVLGRLTQLPVAAADLLQACSVLGDGAEPTVARLLAQIDSLAAERAADSAGHMELLKSGRPYAFSSALIRWAVYYDIPTARRSHLHARAAQLLAEHGTDDAAVAEHLLATEPVGDVEQADRLQLMGRAARAAGNLRLALRCFNRALAESPPAAHGGSMYLDLASVEMTQDGPSALTHFGQAVRLGVDDDTELISVAVGLLRHVATTPEHNDAAVRAVQGLTGRLDGVDRRLAVEFELALAVASGDPVGRSAGIVRLRALLGEDPALDRSEAERDLAQMASTFVTLQEIADGSITADELAHHLEPVIDVDRLASPDPMVADIQAMAFLGLLYADRFAAVDDLLWAAQRAAHEREDVASEHRASLLAATSLLWQGSLTAAEEAYRRGRKLGIRLGSGSERQPTLGLVDALLRQGRVDDAERCLDQLDPDATSDQAFGPAFRIERGRLLVARGLLRDGLDQFTAAGDEARRAGIVNPVLSSWRADSAMVLSSLGEWAEAGRLADDHLGLARRFGGIRTLGIGLRAAAAARPDLADRTDLLVEAVELLEESPARLEASYALIELGTVLVERSKKEEARGVLRRGANLASLCGAHQLVESAGVQLRAAGARPRRLGYIGPDSLTPSERRVARLAAAGQTNQGIASDLFVTVKTVEGHLAKTYRKLGVDSRRSLALALGDDDGDGDELPDASSL